MENCEGKREGILEGEGYIKGDTTRKLLYDLS